ncbi:hypothetical protein K1719_018624 [Acacia pycnantha]|nr:hypothetical protein K1719_018624 [Acacia pycnantha]
MVPSSLEEDDILNRSSKKIKNGELLINSGSWPRLGYNQKAQWEAGPSFAEKLQGINGDNVKETFQAEANALSDDSISDSENEDSEPLCKIVEDPNRNFPTFTFLEKMKKRLYKAWNKALIVKLLGKEIGYKLLLSILQSLWAKKGVITLINIGNGFFVVKFTNKEDYSKALTGGPWMIFDHYLTVRPWEPLVRHEEEKAEIVVVLFVGESQVKTQREHSVRSIREKKGKNQNKKHPKSKGVPKVFDLVTINKQEQRHDKRTRESTQKVTSSEDQQSLPDEFLNEDAMELQLEKPTIHPKSKEESVNFGKEGQERDPDADALLEEEGISFISNPHDPGDSSPTDGPSGKFWVGPETNEPDIFYWNCRGACASNLIQQLSVVCRGNWPTILILAETKCDTNSRFRCLERIGYNGMSFVPSVGRSGGIVAAWRNYRGSVSVIRSNRQFIHLLCSWGGMQPFICDYLFYSLPHFQNLSLAELKGLSLSISAPWVTIGDFNDVLAAGERLGGSRVNFSRIRHFQDRIDGCHLTDLGFVGPKFTWKGPRLPNCARLYERLDRALQSLLLAVDIARLLLPLLFLTW